VLLAQNHILLPVPLLVEFAEATVAVSFQMHLPVLFPSQLQRPMRMSLELLVERGKVGKGTLPRSIYGALFAEQRFFDAFLVPAFRNRSPDPGRGRFLEIVMDCSLADRTGSGDLPLPQPQLKVKAEDFLGLTHGLCSREHNPCNVPDPVMCPTDRNCHISSRKPLSADT
jgi:hypothetical protein